RCLRRSLSRQERRGRRPCPALHHPAVLCHRRLRAAVDLCRLARHGEHRNLGAAGPAGALHRHGPLPPPHPPPPQPQPSFQPPAAAATPAPPPMVLAAPPRTRMAASGGRTPPSPTNGGFFSPARHAAPLSILRPPHRPRSAPPSGAPHGRSAAEGQGCRRR